MDSTATNLGNRALQVELCTQKEKRLAELLGWTQVTTLLGSVSGIPPAPWPATRHMCPRWTRDWSACGPLMVEHGIWVKMWENKGGDEVEAQYRHRGRFPTVYTKPEDHADRDKAFMFAAVQAVIHQLETMKGTV